MAGRQSHSTLAFGDFVLDVPAYELRKDGRRVRLERLAMDLLILLVDRRDQLVTRSEIVERLWGPDVFVEVDASVNTLVRKIRLALGDGIDQPRFIQTVQGKGYRFIADVEIVPEASALTHASPPSTRPPPDSTELPLVPPPQTPVSRDARGSWVASRLLRNPGRAAAVFGAVLLVVLGSFAWSQLRGGPRLTSVTVAVMPFENLSGDPGRDYLIDGLTEETAASLGQSIEPQRLVVIGRISTRSYKGTRKSPGEIGRELAADYLVIGSFQADSDRLRITTSLVRVRDQVQVWSNSYDYRQPTSMLAMQQELGSAVAQQIRLSLSPEQLDGLAQRQTQNADAYDFYLKGRYFWNQLTPAMTRRALEAYGRATALDQNYALAWSGIADAYTTGPIMGDAEPMAVRALARDATERAINANAMLAETQTSAGVQQFFLEWDWPRGEAGLRRAIQIDASYAMAHRLLGVVLSHTQRAGEARIEMRRARELEPAYVMNHALSAMVEFHDGAFAAAVAHARRALAIDAEFWIAHYHLAQAYEQLGETDLALEELASAARLSQHGHSKALSVRGYILARLGRRDEAADVLSAFEQTAATRYVPPYASALVHAGLGDRDAAFAWLEKAFTARDVNLIFLPVDPKWSPFRADSRFQDLLRRCGFVPLTAPNGT